MEDKFSNIKERVLQIAENKSIPKEKFFEMIGMTYGNFKGKSKKTPLNSNAIADISALFPEIDLNWLITGKRKEDILANILEDPLPYKKASKDIPLVNTEAIAGFGNNHFNIKEDDIAAKYTVPDFTNIDFMIKIRGSSMYPKYNAGDIVACRIIRQSSFIQWNKTYIIATTEQGILCKRLKKGSTAENYLAISDNKEYDPFEIPISEITGIALVIGVIRLE